MAHNGILYATTALQYLSEDVIPFNEGTRADVGRGGAWLSTNGGDTWQQIFDEIYQLTDIKSDTYNSNILYITAKTGKVYVSTSGTATTIEDWIEINGFNFYAPAHIFEDPNNRTRFYVTTTCGGTWSLPIPEDPITVPNHNDAPHGNILKVYPNPTNTRFTVELEKSVNSGLLTLFDTNGRIVVSQTITGSSALINVSQMAAGSYILRLSENGNYCGGGVIVKE
jgi:DNA-binding beta-propeller fold protein YncE